MRIKKKRKKKIKKGKALKQQIQNDKISDKISHDGGGALRIIINMHVEKIIDNCIIIPLRLTSVYKEEHAFENPTLMRE